MWDDALFRFFFKFFCNSIISLFTCSTLRVTYHGHVVKHACVHTALVELSFVLRQADVIQPPWTRERNSQLSVMTNSVSHHVALVLLLAGSIILILIIILTVALHASDLRVTQLKSSLLLASSSSEPRAWSANWSFFLCRGCLMPSSYNTRRVHYTLINHS